MRDLIALDIHSRNAFVDACVAIWDVGDAVLPIDTRAPRTHLQHLLWTLRPAAIVSTDGERTALGDGIPVEAGDAVVIATSGTTGTPKGVVHTHDSMTAAAQITGLATHTDRDSHWLACLPLSHIGGFSVITRALLNGADITVDDGFDSDSATRANAQGASHVSLVPTVLGRIDPTIWDLILLGGSSIPKALPPNCVGTYGMTETFGGVIYDGKPLEGIDVRVTPESIIEIRSPSLFRCYRSSEQPGVSKIPGVGDDGYYNTGDIGSLDEATSTLTVHGRSDDLIITGGVKVWPEPVERIIGTHPKVRECAVIGQPDPEWGHRVTAIVVPTNASTPPDLAELRHMVKAELPAAAAPRELVLRASLPRTQSGKIRRRLSLPTVGGAGQQ